MAPRPAIPCPSSLLWLLATAPLVLGLLAGCPRDEFGEPVATSVEEQALQSEFGFEESDDSLPEYRRAAGVKTEECYLAYRHPTSLTMCVYTFGDPAQAREAADQAARRKLPFGRYRTHLARESQLFVVDGQLKDQPIADLLRSELDRIHDLVQGGK
ncbi:MAG TPA: hypothetical protein PK668_05880 [Myxococcota bacterium]|nr:hypothetical protein [Myxococcota bacterium]HRY92630.1 hypothetical protein [Myxococcota bacterium]HSA24316.1 hypothetical protein [Myxococcota bacterium]